MMDNLPTWDELAEEASEILEDIFDDLKRQNQGNHWRSDQPRFWQIDDWLKSYRKTVVARKAEAK